MNLLFIYKLKVKHIILKFNYFVCSKMSKYLPEILIFRQYFFLNSQRNQHQRSKRLNCELVRENGNVLTVSLYNSKQIFGKCTHFTSIHYS